MRFSVLSNIMAARLFSSSSFPSIFKIDLAPSVANISRYLLFFFQNQRFESAVRFVLQVNANQIDCQADVPFIFASAMLQHHEFHETRSLIKACAKNLSEFDRIRMLNFLIQGLCTIDNAENALQLLKEWRRTEGAPLSSSLFHSLIYSLVNRDLVHEAAETPRHLAAFKCLLLKLYQCDDAVNFINSSNESNVTHRGLLDSDSNLDVLDYSVLIHRLCKEDRLREALELCAILKKNKKLTINIVIYNTILTALCRHGCITEAFRLFDSLETMNLKPSEITFGILIDSLSKQGRLFDAELLLQRMIGEGTPPRTRIYNSLIDNYCKLGKMEDAWRMIRELENRDLECDDFTVSSMINGFCRRGDVQEALSFFAEFGRKGLSPDILGFVYLMRGLRSKGRMEETRSVLMEMLRTESVVEVIRKFSLEESLLLACDEGDLDEAMAILEEVLRVFFPAWRSKKEKSSSFYALYFDDIYSEIELLCSEGRVDEADRRVREMITLGGNRQLS